MVFWATVTYLVYLLVSQTRPTFIDDAHTWMDKINIILFLTEMPDGATLHLGFLRDLFVCVLLSPLLLPALQRMAWLLLPILAAFYLFEHSQASVIILRPLVLFAFSIGIYLAIRKARLDALDRYWAVFVVLAIASTMAILLFNSGIANSVVQAFAAKGLQFDETVLYPVGRLFGSLALWTLLPFMLNSRLRDWTTKFSPYLFAAFCSHYLMLTLLFYGAWQPLFGGREASLFTLWFLAAPLVSMAVAVLCVKVALLFMPPLASLITGGRVNAPTTDKDGLSERRRQGVALGIWLTVTKTADSLISTLGAAIRQWLELSRKLLMGRR